MIPVEEKQLQEVDIVVRKRDREKIKMYKHLCENELKWCQAHIETICNKANVLYQKCISGEVFSGKVRCLDFLKLEHVCKKYNTKLRENKT